MKKLEELGISPAPWEAGTNHAFATLLDGYEGKVIYANGDPIKVPYVGFAKVNKGEVDAAIRNARLMAAAPEMYECLRDAVIEMCHDCPNCGPYPDYQCKNKACECFLNEWRKVLAKAAGENEAIQREVR